MRYLVVPARELRVLIAGFGQVEFPPDSAIAETRRCGVADDCLVEVPAAGDIEVSLLGAVGGQTPRLRELATGDCELVGDVTPGADPGAWTATVRLGEASPPVCHFEFPATAGMVNVPIQVNGGATVEFGVPGTAPSTCTAQPPSATCRAEVAYDSAFEVRITDTPHAEDVLWGGDCVVDAGDPLKAMIPRVADGSRCEVTVEAPADCEGTPRIRLFNGSGEPISFLEISYQVPGQSLGAGQLESEVVTLEAGDIMSTGAAAHVWTMAHGTDLTEVGTDNPTEGVRLRCGQSELCELRYQLDDGCGRRTAVALFEIKVD